MVMGEDNMREGDELTSNQKQLMREMNQYAQDINSSERFTADDISNRFSDANAKTLLENNTFESMYIDNVTKPKKIGRVGSIRLGRDIGRKKKSTKPKSKRKSIKKKGCGCK
jgi:hypothetical protein